MFIKNLRTILVITWIAFSLYCPIYSADDLVNQFHNMGLNPQPTCNRWTHFPKNGDTLYIMDDAQITTSSKHHAPRKYDIVDTSVKDFFCNLNHGLYFGNYGGKANHLFISFRIAFIPPQQNNLYWKKFVLCWDEPLKQFIYHDFENLPKDACFADFYNQTPAQWENNKPIIVKDKRVKFVSFTSHGVQGVVGDNRTHSEPGALGFLEARKDLLLELILRQDPLSKFKFFQVGLHSFLDFCSHCDPMVDKFQESFRNSLLSYLTLQLPKKHALSLKIQDKSSHLLLLLSGINNRLYFNKTYYFYDEGTERAHRFASYFLQQYRPFSGKFPWKKTQGLQPRLMTFINEPVAQSDSIEMLPHNLRIMMPLNQATFYWSMAAHTLYENVDEVIKLFTPNLVMADLANARLGVNEGDDDGESWSASQGEEVVKVLRAMKICIGLQHLNLSGNYIVQDEIVRQLPTLFAPFSQLTYLSFAEALPHNQTALSFVGNSLACLPSLTQLDLSRNSLNYDMFANLIGGLNALPLLRKLDLSHNRLSVGYDFEEDYKGGAEEDTAEAIDWVCSFIHITPSILEVDLTYNGFDGIAFYWSEVTDNAGLTKQQLKAVYKKLHIEDDAGGYFSESSDSIYSSTSDEDEDEGEEGDEDSTQDEPS